jgi:putative tryptophan/tyrosine transport system substrate-binding protein
VDRRTFVVSGGAVLVVPRVARAQQAGRVARIGYLSGNPRADTLEAMDAFRVRLREAGYVEGQNLFIDHRYADGKHEKLPTLAAELVRQEVDVILTFGTRPQRARRRARRAAFRSRSASSPIRWPLASWHR